MKNKLGIALLGLTLSLGAIGQSSTTLRATDLRADKLADAPVLAALAAGAEVRLIGMEGGWVQVQALGRTGWVRAGALDLKAEDAAVTRLASGRLASGNNALTLGVRSLAPRINRHALIIGISRYEDPATPPLPGAHIDRQSATQMAQAMQVPMENITYLQDDQATGDNIRAALGALTDKVQEGDRVFIHYSGHGTRYNDPSAGGCVEALLAYDGFGRGTLTNHEMATLLKPITNKTDKLFVMYDACHSGGLVQAASSVRTRGFTNSGDEGALRPKFAGISEECGRPVNVKTRNLVVETLAKGTLPQDIIHISASRDNEVSFDDELKGGLATQYMRDCMLRDAKDLDGSGAISVDEIRQCAQEKIEKRMQFDANYKAHHIMLNGNAAFVPAWFSQAMPTAQPAVTEALALPVPANPPAAVPKPPAPAPTPAVTAVAATPAPAAPATNAAAAAAVAIGHAAAAAGATASTQVTAHAPAAAPVPVVAVAPTPVAVMPVATAPVAAIPTVPAPLPALSGDQALRQMFEQRDAKRVVTVKPSLNQLRIGKDPLGISVRSERAGYVYVAFAGSDNQSLDLLFPNDKDQHNRIEAGQTMQLPRDDWRIMASGPVGKDTVLVLVTDAPRDIASLHGTKTGPFQSSLNDANGRAQLGSLMTTAHLANAPQCSSTAKRGNSALCSDAYGATMVTLEEVK